MKKIGLFLLLLILPCFVHAEVDYEIKDYYISSQIETNGNLKMQELIVLDGTFNGYERNIVYKNSSLDSYVPGEINFEKSSIYNASGIKDLKVSTFKVTEQINFETMKTISDFAQEKTNISLGTHNAYSINENLNGIDVKMYKPADHEKIAFYLEYIITNAVVMHNDVAELYFPFVGDKFSDSIENVQVKLVLPKMDNSKNFRFWAHGPLYGKIEKENNKTIIATAKNLEANTGFDIRMTFAKDLIISESLNHSNEDALPKILDIENKRADVANNARHKIKIIYNSIKYSAIVYLVGLIIFWIFIYIKYDKEYKSNFQSKYYREFIEDYDVEVVDYLFNKSITPNAMSASIMNLIYKKNISVEEILEDKKKEYSFTLNTKDNISEAEAYLIEFLFEIVGKENKFTTKELKDYAKSTKTYSTFTTKYTTWKNKVISEGKKQKFYENHNNIKIIGTLYFIIGAVIFFINLSYSTDLIIAYLLIIPALIFLFYILLFNKRSKKGNEDYVRWKAFKNFLTDFATFDKKELPEIVLWERYMVYAVIFGIADKVQKAMNVHIQEMDPDGTIYMPYYNSWLFYNMNYSLAQSINSSVNSAINASINTANAMSANSSGSGFGGGFSSGSGGGFGGGGGGHGF